MSIAFTDISFKDYWVGQNEGFQIELSHWATWNSISEFSF